MWSIVREITSARAFQLDSASRGTLPLVYMATGLYSYALQCTLSQHNLIHAHIPTTLCLATSQHQQVDLHTSD